MFSYVFNNGYMDYKVTFNDGFKRLDYCKAAWYETTTISSMKNGLGHLMHYTHYGLVSYATPIIVIKYAYNETANTDRAAVYVNADSYRCSNSTIHQLVRFLRRTFEDCITYQMIKTNECHTTNKVYRTDYKNLNSDEPNVIGRSIDLNGLMRLKIVYTDESFLDYLMRNDRMSYCISRY